jgi:DNA-binding MarR family transcriptional regulator
MQTVTPPAPARTQSVESVMHALMSIGRLMRQRGQGETLDPGTFWLLRSIAANGSMRVTDIAQHANLDVSTVSRHVAQLQKTGLIERTPDPDDRRAQLVRMTDIGQQKLTADLRARTTLLERSLETWSLEDLDQLDRAMNRFVADVETLSESLENS